MDTDYGHDLQQQQHEHLPVENINVKRRRFQGESSDEEWEQLCARSVKCDHRFAQLHKSNGDPQYQFNFY
jgi:hypothetical protein